MIKDLKQYYQSLYQAHGNSVEAVQHVSQASQYKRFDILTDIDTQLNSIIDIGCGLGDMYHYLNSKGYQGSYLGLDFVDEFIQAASEKFRAHSQANFARFDLTKEKIPATHDYILLSGVFNNNTPDAKQFMLSTIDAMFQACKKGVAFNAMSTYVDFLNDVLFYIDPLEVFDHCKKLGAHVVLKHDYIVKEGSVPYEFTMYLYKDAK